MKAYDKGFADAITGNVKRGRAFETDAANDAYYNGVVAGLSSKHPRQMIVQCACDSTIFPAYQQPYSFHDGDGKRVETEAITCPTCYRRYIKEANGKFVSDRDLRIRKS